MRIHWKMDNTRFSPNLSLDFLFFIFHFQVPLLLLSCVGEGFIVFFFLFFSFAKKELATINDETLLSRIEEVLDERVKPVKGKIGMQRQRFRAIKSGVDLMLDVCRQTHSDLETEMEGKYKIVSSPFSKSFLL